MLLPFVVAVQRVIDVPEPEVLVGAVAEMFADAVAVPVGLPGERFAIEQTGTGESRCSSISVYGAAKVGSMSGAMTSPGAES
ncbi:hypothetical protein ACFYXQ_31365 [Nocardia jiangxiensis]|uniref:Uncharacterized protein n=1 Tax=Nocardia jiangxiensis TaxID=282685 RepID=A0ABW6S7L7_9NOCA